MADTSPLNQRTLLLGSGGMIGTALSRRFAGPNLFAFRHQELDISDYFELEKQFIRLKPHVVLNSAAFTRVDDCEKLREVAFLINAQAPAHLASLCRKYDAFLVHFSSDYVFDGKSDRPYLEEDMPSPINYYGMTKWESEKRIALSGCSYLIVRTSWIFGKNGSNFVEKTLKRALAGAKLQAPIDQIGAPTYSSDVATAVLKLLSCNASGLFHFANFGSCSRYEQAVTILNLYGLNNSVETVKNDDLPLPAKRPHFSVLSISRYVETTGHQPRSWQDSTAEYIQYLKQSEKELQS